MRSEADDAWINIGYLDQTANAFRILDDTQVTNTSGTQTGLLGDQATSAWEAGTSTTESLVSPAKVKAAIDALASGGKTWLAPVATTSSTAIDVTSLPSGITEIVIQFRRVSTNGSSHILVQFGTSGGFVTTGYETESAAVDGTNTTNAETSGFILRTAGSDREQVGVMRFYKDDADRWTYEHNVRDTSAISAGSGDSPDLGGTLTQIRLTTVGGTDTFDNGEIVIGYQ